MPITQCGIQGQKGFRVSRRDFALKFFSVVFAMPLFVIGGRSRSSSGADTNRTISQHKLHAKVHPVRYLLQNGVNTVRYLLSNEVKVLDTGCLGDAISEVIANGIL